MIPSHPAPDMHHLLHGDFTVEGQFMWGSNYTLLANIQNNGHTLKAVYKPTRGERPLWDFPSESLAGREVAAFLVSQALGWDLVPPTVFRPDGPAGPGSLQLFIDHDPQQHYFSFTAGQRARLRPVALFDALINNTDRKGGHIILDFDEKFWLIDHGICFHAEPKLRTVIWDFAGQAISPGARRDIADLRQALQPDGALAQSLAAYLTPAEVAALRQRTARLLTAGVFPSPTNGRYSYPWPPV